MERRIIQSSYHNTHKAKNCESSFVYEGNKYCLLVKESNSKREIILKSQDCSYGEIDKAYYLVNTLLMICDGYYYDVVSAFDNSSDITISWKHKELPSYKSAEFIVSFKTELLDYEIVISNLFLEKWAYIYDKLDMLGNMLSYCMSSSICFKDIQCAFMIESLIGICELIASNKKEYELPVVKKGQSKIQKYFLSVIDNYGKEIFANESAGNIVDFAQILVNSRNRIAHIKDRQDKVYLTGEGCVKYSLKLFLLYRSVVLDLIGVPKETYYHDLINSVNKIDEHFEGMNLIFKA